MGSLYPFAYFQNSAKERMLVSTVQAPDCKAYVVEDGDGYGGDPYQLCPGVCPIADPL